MILIPAILLGFLGSMHCVGMCGPIVISIPVNNNGKFSSLVSNLLYNFGRVTTYSFFGLILGLLGESISLIFLQSHLSIFLGSVILLYLILPKSAKSFIKSNGKLTLKIGKLKQSIGKNLLRTSPLSSYILGVLNGFLPCGLVYAALAGALATASVLNSVLFMALFGIGTIPAMALLYHFKNQIDLQLRQKLNKIIPYGIAFVAILMILRGLNLGIPMISPNFDKSTLQQNAEECCEPSEILKPQSK
jgi:hypothetical protein